MMVRQKVSSQQTLLCKASSYQYGMCCRQASSELTLIQVLNPSPDSVALYENEKVAVAKSINHILCNTTQEAEHDSSIKIKMEDAVQQMLHGTTKLSEKERDAAVALLSEFKDVIALGDDDLGRTGIIQHSIETGSSQPVRQQSRKLPFHQKPVVCKLLDSMLSRDIIEPSHGPWASPVKERWVYKILCGFSKG